MNKNKNQRIGVKDILCFALSKGGKCKIDVKPKSENVYIKAVYNNKKFSDLVSIVIPFKDEPELLKKCIKSILYISTYRKLEIVAVDNNSKNPDTFRAIEKVKTYAYDYGVRIKFLHYKNTFNFSAINNYASTFAKGKYLIFMNNDVEIITPHWIENMLMYASLATVGVVGAKLLYANNLIQHAGIVMMKNGLSEHIGRFLRRDTKTKMLLEPRYVMANTGALMMISRKKFIEIGGFEESLEVYYNDVDLCLKCLERGYLNVWLPNVEAYHHESISVNKIPNLSKVKKFVHEQMIFYKRHKIESDIYYDYKFMIVL